MTARRAELSSIASTLNELTDRISAITDEVLAEDESAGAGLLDAERSLRAANRRLATVVDRL
ncbi:MAG: hypothetical protein KDB33_15775 [Acidimicrobiales bacterium]|nr:hypothetical protein [Acidimicrobiales bacterium]MCB1261827.1 hypothetical protein [Acidimicrobiales bacterium]